MTDTGLRPADALRAGDLLAGRYCLVRALGEGGMGVVWEARQVTTDKLVAIKVLKGLDAADAARFLREAKVCASLSHRNIVQVFDLWELPDGGPVFMVMERLVGETLAAVLGRERMLPALRLLSIILPVASALRASHARGIVHRDLKPENIFLARASEDEPVDVKVLDFGLARPVTADASTTAITQTGSVMGTPFYMAPEQIYGERDVDIRADVWSLGVILYECLSGQRPFTGDNFGQVFRSVSLGTHRPLSQVAPETPPGIVALVSRMLSHDKAARPTLADVSAVLANPDTTLVLAEGPTTQRMPSIPPPTEAPAIGNDEALPAPEAAREEGAGAPATIAATGSPAPTPAAASRQRTGVLVGLAVVGAATVAVLTLVRPTPASGPPVVLAPLSSPSQLPESLPIAVAPAPETAASPSVTPTPAAPADTPAKRPVRVPPRAPPATSHDMEGGLRTSGVTPTASAPVSQDPLNAGRF